MLQLLLSSALVLSLHAAPAEGGGGAVVPEAPPSPMSRAEAILEDDQPPPGTPEEVALWRAGLEATKTISMSRSGAAYLQAKAKGQAYKERLDAAIRVAGHEAAERLVAARKRLEQAWSQDLEIFRRRWPVDPYRGCGYPQLYYDSALRLAPGPNRQAEVDAARGDLKSCVSKANLATKPMMAANVALAAAIAEVERELAAAKASGPARGEAEAHEAHERHESREHPEGK